MYNITVGMPSDFSEEDIVIAASLVKSGGALDASVKALAGRLKRSHKLAVCKSGSQLIGVASIKEPDAGYRSRVFQKAGMPLSRFSAAPELGYVTVHGSWRKRGIAEHLVQALLKQFSEECYATTDTRSMEIILTRFGFAKQGQEWEGQRGALSLWTRS